MSLLAPALNRLLDSADRFARGEAPAEEVRACLPDARAFCAEGRSLFGLVAPGLLRSPAVDRLLDECRQDLDAQEAEVARLEAALEEGSAGRVGAAAGRLREAAVRLAGGFGDLHEEEKKERIYSPFPAVDHFVKVGMNVLEGHESRDTLADRFPPVVALVERLGRDVERFAALYEAPQVARVMGELMASLRAGLGATMEFLEHRDRGALADALKLLGRGTAEVHEGLAEMDRVAAAARGEGHAYLLELQRALERGIRWPLVQDAWALVRGVEEHYRRELDAFRRAPLYPFLAVEEASAREALDAVTAELGRLDPASAAAVAGLAPLFDALVERVQRLWGRLEEEMARYRDALHLEELRERVGRALLGEPSEELLRERLAHFHALQRDLAAQAAGLEPELAALFAAQDEAYAVMLGGLGDPAELRRGWDAFEATLPRMLEIAQGLRAAIAAQAAPAAGVTCMRCARSNAPGARYCAGCNAVLPQLGGARAEEVDITGGEAGARPSRLGVLEERIADGDLAGVLAEVKVLEEMAGAMARNLGGPAEVGAAEYATYFAERVEAYRQGLAWIRDCAEAGDADGMWRGLEGCRAAEEDVVELKREIDAALS